MFAPSILNTHLDITVTLDSDMITKDTFVFVDNRALIYNEKNIRYQGGVTKQLLQI